jgi:hypothetical protein
MAVGGHAHVLGARQHCLFALGSWRGREMHEALRGISELPTRLVQENAHARYCANGDTCHCDAL